MTMLGIILAGLLGTMVGSWVAYGVGRGGRLELLERHGGKLHMGPAQIERADRWFQRYGEPTVLFGRLDPARPGVRVAARGRREDAARALHGALADRDRPRGWSGSRSPGKALGGDWTSARKYFEYVDYAILALVVVGVVYAIVQRRRRADPATDVG